MIRQRYYNPGQLTDEELKAGFVARQYELQDVVRTIRDEPAEGALQHILIIGPRGMGKTSLGLRTLVEVREDAGLSGLWQPVPFFEESYGVSDLAALWLTALHHLADATNEPEWAKRADALLAREKDTERLAAGAYAALADYRRQSGKRPILFVENLDDLFAQFLVPQDLARLRSLLQERNDVLLLGTANSVFEAITSSGEPFYEFFKQVRLQGLDRKETFSFLGALAERSDLADLRQVLSSSPGRVEAVRNLTGGNPRLIALAARMMAESPTGTAREDLERLIDDQTPYFKARIESLSPQLRVVFHTLAAGWKPMLASEVAKEARLSSSHASAQLKSLIDRGYAEVVPANGKRSNRYQILERFYNIYYLLRFTRDQRKRLETLIDYISDLFGSGAISRMTGAVITRIRRNVESTPDDWMTLEVLAKRLTAQRSSADRNMLLSGIIKLCKEFGADNTSIWRDNIFHTIDDPSARGDAIELLRNHLDAHPFDADAWIDLGILQAIAAEWQSAASSIKNGINCGAMHCSYFTMIGNIYTHLDEEGRSIDSWKRAIALDPQYSNAWESIGDTLFERGDMKNTKPLEIALKASILLAPDNHEKIAKYATAISARDENPDYINGLKFAKRSAEICPSHWQSWLVICGNNLVMGRPEVAKQISKIMRFVSRDHSELAITMGMSASIHAVLGLIVEAICAIEEISSIPESCLDNSEKRQAAEIANSILVEAIAAGYEGRVAGLLISSWLGNFLEPLKYAAMREALMEIPLLPAEVAAATQEVQQQIADLRKK
jgi:tetratricopeptide (TPR) repeat protein